MTRDREDFDDMPPSVFEPEYLKAARAVEELAAHRAAGLEHTHEYTDTERCVICGAMPAHIPSRESDVAAWIKRARDREIGGRYAALDDLLDDYRLHADTGTPLSKTAYEPPATPTHCGGHAGPCSGHHATTTPGGGGEK